MDEVSALRANVARFMKQQVAPHVGPLDLQPAAPARVAVPALLAPLGLPGLDGAAEELPPATLARLLWTMAGECAGVAAYVALAAAGRLVASRFGDGAPAGPLALAPAAGPLALGLFEGRELLTADGTVDVAARVEGQRVIADKRAVPLAPAAAAFGLLARRGAELCVAWVAPGAGVTVGAPVGLLGVRAVPCADLRVSGAPLVACATLQARDLEWLFGLLGLLLGACAGGTAAAAITAARAYARDRYQGGVMIEKHEAVALMLETGDAHVAAARDALFAAADGFGDEPASWRAALHAKIATAPLATNAALDAVQCLGGYGYMRDYGLEKRLRDATTLGLLPLDATRLALLCRE
jgi:alkylation response protein AidB-like acyl-CoA dehydrogenase